MVSRGIRWNMRINTGEQERTRYRYTFALINEPREIERIKQRILERMAVVDEFISICDYRIIKSNGLHCRVFSFSSDRGVIERPKEIYDNLSQFKRDRNLVEKDEVGILRYLEKMVA